MVVRNGRFNLRSRVVKSSSLGSAKTSETDAAQIHVVERTERPKSVAHAREICRTTPSRSSRPSRRRVVLIAIVLAAAVFVAVPSVGAPIWRAMGRVLVVDEPVAPADIIVIATDTGGAGVLQAADLVHDRIATRVAVFADPPRGEDLEFIRRGLPYEDAAARQIRQLEWLGITDVVKIPRNEAGSGGEGEVLAPWSDQNAIRSIVFVAARDHSRRIRRVLNRAMKGHTTRVMIQGERYSGFHPDHWWETRTGMRMEIVELQKLVLDFVLHPFS
jgi:hypothetical protein